MTLKQVFKRILTVILCFLVYFVILVIIFNGREDFIDWKANTFDLDGDGMFGGIEETKEKVWWGNLNTSDARIFMIIFVPLESGLFTLITCIIMAVIKRIKKRHIVKIVILCSLIYFIILNLLLVVVETSNFNTPAFFLGITKEWEYWVLQSLFFSPRLLLISEILTLITMIIILVINRNNKDNEKKIKNLAEKH